MNKTVDLPLLTQKLWRALHRTRARYMPGIQADLPLLENQEYFKFFKWVTGCKC
jgi:hypothetical protein